MAAGNRGWAIAAALGLAVLSGAVLSGAPAAAFPFNEYGGYGGYPFNDGGLFFRDRPYFSDRPPFAPASRPARRRHDTARTTEPKAQPQKLSGPLILAVSIGSQHVTVYDNGVPVASAPVSTGMNGHPTPLGVFSVIQKQKWHESNLYSNAPMPYMQRITWSGIALHAGVLPGYRASHGCIRLPYEFAVRLWGMTRIGARVVVTRNDVPVFDIDHPRLAALVQKPSDAVPPAPPAPDPKASDEKISTAAELNGGKGAAIEPWAAGLRPALAVLGAQVPPFRTPSKPSGPAPATAADPSPERVAQPVQPVQPVQPSPAKPAEPALRPGPVSLFVSRKEGKLFVRKGFEPVFDMPVRIEHPEAPIGTHVFTAGGARPAEGETGLRWFAVSIPDDRDAQPEPRGKSRRAREERPVASAEPPRRSAAEALDRVELPPEALERIAPLMTPGASLVIADQGLGQETGKETDFIVVTR